MRQAERYRLIVERFAREMPEPKTELSYSNPFELLTAAVSYTHLTLPTILLV